MTSYLFRLFAISLAAFFILHTLLAILALVMAPSAMRKANGMRAASASRLLLALRLAPAVLSLFLVLGLGVPSYLLLEPQSNIESVSVWCITAAILGAASLFLPMLRAARACFSSIRLNRYCRTIGKHIHLDFEPAPSYVIEDVRPVLALSGIVHPRIVVSSGILNALPAPLLEAALRHESAHLAAHDNLKKLALLTVPGVLPNVHGFRLLEQSWSRYAEWAADDCAAGDDRASALSLAEALVRIARMPAAPKLPVLTASFSQAREEFSARLERLLEPGSTTPKSTSVFVPAVSAFAAAAVMVLFRIEALHAVHQLLECFID